MSNRTPHRDYQRTYSTLLNVPMDRTISPEVGAMLDSPEMRDQTAAELVRLFTNKGELLTFIQAAECPRCPAVFIHYPHEDQLAGEWLALHKVAKHTVTDADEFRKDPIR